MLPLCLGLTEVHSGRHLNDPEGWYGAWSIGGLQGMWPIRITGMGGEIEILAQGKENFEKDSWLARMLRSENYLLEQYRPWNP